MVQINLPAGIRTPGAYAEFDPTRATTATGQVYRLLVIGQRLGTGTVAAETPTPIRSAEEASTAFGAGSICHAMAQALFANNVSTEAIFVAVDDPGGGAKATGTFTVAVTTPKTGTVYAYVGGRRYTVAVTAASTDASIATDIAAAITADPNAHVTAAAALAVVTVTAKHAGTLGDEIDLRVNHQADEVTPEGVTVSVAPMSGGTLDPDLANLIAALGDEQYNVIASAYTDAVALTALEAELADRFGPLRQIEGVAIAAVDGTFGETSAKGLTRNSPHLTMVGTNKSPTTPWEYAAAVAGVVAFFGASDPARPFQTLPLGGVLAPRVADRWDQAERDLLLHDGIATTITSPGGTVQIERLITTYRLTPQSVPDTAYLDLTTLLTLGLIRFELRAMMLTRFARSKLAADGTAARAGSSVVTPSMVRAEILALFRSWEERGLVEGVDQFKADLVVEINATDPTRLDIYLPPNLVNGLRVIGVQIGFRL